MADIYDDETQYCVIDCFFVVRVRICGRFCRHTGEALVDERQRISYAHMLSVFATCSSSDSAYGERHCVCVVIGRHGSSSNIGHIIHPMMHADAAAARVPL